MFESQLSPNPNFVFFKKLTDQTKGASEDKCLLRELSHSIQLPLSMLAKSVNEHRSLISKSYNFNNYAIPTTKLMT